jgi:hypothetical protein
MSRGETMNINFFKNFTATFFVGIAVVLFVSACGKSSNDSGAPGSVYNVVYVPGTGMNAPVEGKTAFQLVITKASDGSAATGLSPTVSFMMTMNNGMQHSTPADMVTESTTTPGTYNCTAYYLMASGPTMGTWAMNVTVGGETTTFNPDVAMAMGSDTVRATLYGADDVVSGMSGTSYNKYYLFRDGMISASMPALKLYISHGENDNMNFVPVSIGSVLASPTGTVSTMTVQASSDGGAWKPGIDGGGGHWTISGLTGLATGVTSTIQVKVSVNGQVKTSDGTTEYATFLITP